VFAVIATIIYSWGLYRFVWRLPSWLHYLTAGEILGILSYLLITALLESLLLVSLLLGLCALLPHLFRDSFLARGTGLTLGFFIGILSFMIVYEQAGSAYLGTIPYWTLGALALAILFGWLFGRVRVLASFAAWTSDRLLVFLYLFLPLTALGLIVVAARNLF
jgi:hypothetical protein